MVWCSRPGLRQRDFIYSSSFWYCQSQKLLGTFTTSLNIFKQKLHIFNQSYMHIYSSITPAMFKLALQTLISSKKKKEYKRHIIHKALRHFCVCPLKLCCRSGMIFLEWFQSLFCCLQLTPVGPTGRLGDEAVLSSNKQAGKFFVCKCAFGDEMEDV